MELLLSVRYNKFKNIYIKQPDDEQRISNGKHFWSITFFSGSHNILSLKIALIGIDKHEDKTKKAIPRHIS